MDFLQGHFDSSNSTTTAGDGGTITVTEVNVVSQKLLDEMPSTSSRHIVSIDGAAAGRSSTRSRITTFLDSSLYVVMDVVADCPDEVDFTLLTSTVLEQEMESYEAYIKEHSVLGAVSGAYFNVADEFEAIVIDVPSAMPSNTLDDSDGLSSSTEEEEEDDSSEDIDAAAGAGAVGAAVSQPFFVV